MDIVITATSHNNRLSLTKSITMGTNMDCACKELISNVKDLSKGICKKCGKKFKLVKDSPRGLQGIAWEEDES